MLSLAGFVWSLSIFSQIDSTALDKVFGKKGAIQGNVYKITFPRSDLKVSINGFAVAPALALTSWIGFIKMGDDAMMMGDLVLLDSEESKVVSKLFKHG